MSAESPQGNSTELENLYDDVNWTEALRPYLYFNNQVRIAERQGIAESSPLCLGYDVLKLRSI